ncbi:RagB/SusD family nutrient uptake outer membrane protein [Salegentibacter sp. LM13S]|uniref:RagB/SusD family nutrient uptake outer membrane protein n=1 Tax=Salegentibacter lacus TaxID=2873599 RepID=UPI001CCEF732|nr:RagB/SusD family nutrient uptake outer membrane protein [Salegentibacter lacus]MBZ9630957.1 RagB/SusD family nutrient uptake outer membrane protein [Salegentibacter lacus]
MRKNIIYFWMICATSLFALSACQKDFLEEENRSALDSETIFADPESFNLLVANVYEAMRPATGAYDRGPENIGFHDLNFTGTDIFTRQTAILGTDELNDYVNLNPVNPALEQNWKNYYAVIAAANSAIDRSEEITNLSEETRSIGIGEVKFMRAYAYFHLVEQFGDVPLVLNEIRGAQTDFSRAPEVEVYMQITQDLNDALAVVDENPEQYGKVSKDAVRHLKALVLLTRGYKSFAGSGDFEEAASLAEVVIDNHSLVSEFENLFALENQRNSEIIWSILYGSNPVTQGIGNNRHQLFKFAYDVYPGMTRSTNLHRGIGPAPTPFFYSLFEENDERDEATFRRVIYAELDYLDAEENVVIAAGDTAIYFPERQWSDAEKEAVPYQVINPDEYFVNDGITQVHFPMFKKFDDPGVPYTTGGQAFLGERDAVIFRSGGTRLIAAEAYFMAGNPDEAANHLNAIRSRAGITTLLEAGDVDIDLILNERAKELAGETSRWMTLKRTENLIERVLTYNPHAALNNAITEKHLVRPIPQSEIQVTEGQIEQNPGY